MKFLLADRLTGFFDGLAAGFDLRLPILLPDGTRALGSLEEGPLAMQGGAIPGKPTAPFSPQHGLVFAAAGAACRGPEPARPLFVAGFTHRDLACLRFIDRFFADGLPDDLYFLNRKNAVVAGVSGYCGADGALLPPAGGNCDLEFIWDGSRWLVLAYTEAGRELTEALPECEPDAAFDELQQAAGALISEDDAVLLRASGLLRGDRVPDSFWSEIGDRCIACSGCNLACPTCTCFGVQDWRYSKKVERSRMWDSCQLDGFMREASGHNPLGTEALRSRRRIHHKLAADPRRWGEISCFACGRCDAVCPTGIGMLAVAREMLARFG